MFVELWQVAVLIVGLCFLILTIFIVGVLQNINKTMDQLRILIGSNTESISSITKELAAVVENAATITDDLTEGMDDINKTLESVHKTTKMVEETVEVGKDQVIMPIMGLLNLGKGIKGVAGILHKDK